MTLTQRDVPDLDIEKACVLGAGTMGRGIAVAFSNTGIPVTIIDPSHPAVDAAKDAIQTIMQRATDKGRITNDEAHQRLALITYSTDDDGYAQADVIIEAAFEDLSLKHQLFKKMDRLCKPGCILATNTSSLDIDDIARVTSRPDDVLGLHFFSPAHVMKLLEIVRGAKTSGTTLNRARDLGIRLGKTSVVVGNCPGFTGNRMYHKYNAQAFQLLEDGATPSDIDCVLKDFGFAMGPLAVGDLSGLDIGWNIRKEKAKTEGIDDTFPIVQDMICEAGRFGQKTGKGWYRYNAGDRMPFPDDEANAIIKAASEKRGILRRPIKDQEILQRCLYALVNEGAKLLTEGMVDNAHDIDTVWTAGYGFPKTKIGPMAYADQIGLTVIVSRLEDYFKNGVLALRPAQLLISLAQSGQTFADWKKPI